jgi:hypothetical protein
MNHLPVDISRDGHIYVKAAVVCRKFFTRESYNDTVTTFCMCEYIIYFKLLKYFSIFKKSEDKTAVYCDFNPSYTCTLLQNRINLLKTKHICFI